MPHAVMASDTHHWREDLPMFDRWSDGADEARSRARRARERMVNAMPRRDPDNRSMLLAGLLSAAIGAAAAYLFDPERGRTRRARLLDQGGARLRELLGTLGGQAQRARFIAFEIRQQIAHRGDGQPMPGDAALSDRVHSELFADPSIPRYKMNINVEEGVVVLRGEVDESAQADDLIRRAEQIPGVMRVDSLLHLPGEPAPPETPRKHASWATAGPEGPLP